MKIAICGSMQFHQKMRELKTLLEKAGHEVFLPKGVIMMETQGFKVPEKQAERVASKLEHDFIREHFRKIEQSSAILVVNETKNGKSNYIGGNTFLEMGVAFYLKKPIYILNDLPEVAYLDEIAAFQPVILKRVLTPLVKQC